MVQHAVIHALHQVHGGFLVHLCKSIRSSKVKRGSGNHKKLFSQPQAALFSTTSSAQCVQTDMARSVCEHHLYRRLSRVFSMRRHQYCMNQLCKSRNKKHVYMINIYIYITNTLCGNNWTQKTQPKMPAFSAGIWKTRLKQIQKPAKKTPLCTKEYGS